MISQTNPLIQVNLVKLARSRTLPIYARVRKEGEKYIYEFRDLKNYSNELFSINFFIATLSPASIMIANKANGFS